MNRNLFLSLALGTTTISNTWAQNTLAMKSINPHAPVKCSKTISINASPERVWNTITSINNWPAWQKDISMAQLDGKLAAGTTFKWTTNGSKINSTLHTVAPYQHFGWTGKIMGIHAIHNWTLQSNGTITTVTVDESMEGLLTRLFKTKFNKDLEQGMQHWLAQLKAECER